MQNIIKLGVLIVVAVIGTSIFSRAFCCRVPADRHIIGVDRPGARSRRCSSGRSSIT
jgi:hypothetical protein